MNKHIPQSGDDSADSQRLGIRVIARAAAILRALEQHPEGLTLGEIAERVNLPRSTVQRIVDALDHENLVMAASNGAGARLGPGLISLAAAAKFDIADLAEPVLAQLAKDTGETVDLAVLDQNKAVFIAQIPGTQRLRAVSAVAMSFPLHCSASGKALLAALPEAQLEKLRKRIKLPRMTKSTLVTWEELDRELDRVRKEGVAFDREEHSMGVCAVGAALRGPTGELAAISIPVPAQRFASSEKVLIRMLVECCQAFKKRLQRERF